MLALPIISTGDLLIVIGDAEIERLKQQDPAELVWGELFPRGVQPHAIAITYLNKADQLVLVGLMKDDRLREALAFATRGFQYRPDKGDHDLGPTSLLRDEKVDA